MKSIKYSILFLFSLTIYSCVDKEGFDLQPTDPQPYFPGITQPTNLTSNKGEINILASSMEFSNNNPRISIQGSLFDSQGNQLGYESLTINGLEIAPNVENTAPGVNSLGRFNHYFFDDEITGRDNYNKIHQIFGSESNIELSSAAFGNLSKSIKIPSLTGVDLSDNRGYDNPDDPRLYAFDGIKITWDAPVRDNSRSLPPDESVGILLLYDAAETEREVTSATGELYPDENMVYTVITPNDGEHIIDFSAIPNFPDGGIHRVYIGNGVSFNIEVDNTNNIVRISAGTLITSDRFILETCNWHEDGC